MEKNTAKQKKEKAPRPKYNMWQNSIYMIKIAWKEHERLVLVFAILLVILAILSNLVNLYISPAILSAVERHVSFGELIMTILIFVLSTMFLSAANSYISSNTLFGRIGVRLSIIDKLNLKAATTSYPNIDDDKFIKLQTKASAATAQNSSATEAIWNTLVSLLTNILGFLIYLYLLVSLDFILILTVIATASAGYFVNRYVSGYSYRHRDEEAEYINKINYVNEKASDWMAAKDIRIFGIRHWLEELRDKSTESYLSFKRREQGVILCARIIDLFLAFIRNGVAYFYLIRLVVSGDIAVSKFLLLFSAVGGLTGWVSGIFGNFVSLYVQSLDISTVREYIEYPEVFKFEDGKSLSFDNGRMYEIRLENVSYRYPGSDKDVLKNINLTVRPGEKIAVVGLNGAGKTTLVKLICGFLDPIEGRVLLDGRDIREYNRADYYKMFSAVFQKFSLFAGSIATNVAQSENDIDMERVKDCIKKAGLDKKIESLPDGYNTMLNRTVYEDAVMLSGGETQKLMLARALYKNAPFIVLDEPTAALDPIAESEMYSKYSEMTEKKSSVYISHRLASTRFCDRILFIDDASIAETGTHDELIQLGGKYAELFEIQSKYYSDKKEESENER